MTPDVERGVREACDNFQNFVLVQIVGAWFADAPNPQALIDEMIAKWLPMLRTRYETAARKRAEETGVIDTGGAWLDEVLEEAERRIRLSLTTRVLEVRASEPMKEQVN